MIDVIIPAYNANKYIKETLNSIVKQTIKNKVIVTIIDDGSKEKYDNIVKDYSQKLNINLIRLKKNYGVGYARQIGTKKTKNKYIFFLDADDILVKKNSLELLYNKMIENDNLKLVMGKELLNNEIHFYENHLLAKLIIREVIEKYKITIPNYKIGEDTAFMFSILSILEEHEKNVINELIYEHKKVNINSLTSLYLNDKYTYKEYFKAIDFVKKYKKYNYFKKRVFDIFLFLSQNYYGSIIKNDQKDIYLKRCKKFYKRYYNYLGDIQLTGLTKFNEIEYNIVCNFKKTIDNI